MKHTFTLIAGLLAATAGAQTQNQPVHIPQVYRSAEARDAFRSGIGPDAILRAQSRQGQAKTAANFYRITGWSQYNHLSASFVDSAAFFYSGSRASQFADERENTHAGGWWFLSKPDLARQSADGGPVDRSENAMLYTPGNLVRERIFRYPSFTGKSVYTYDAAGKETMSIDFDSIAGGWLGTHRYTSIYNAQGKLATVRIVELPAGTPLGIVEHHYNAAGLEDTMRSGMWTGTEYTEDYRMVTTWSPAGEKLSTTSWILDDNMVLQPAERFEYTYDGASRLKESVSATYENGAWSYQLRDSFGYTGAKALYTLMRSWTWNDGSGAWQPMREWSYSLNAQNLWSNETFMTPGAGGTLEPQSKTEISYNAAGLITKMETFAYDRSLKTYSTNPSESERYYYDLNQPTSVPGQEPVAGVSIWPNPAGAVLNLNAAGAKVTGIDVLSTTGALVLHQGGAALRVDMTQIPAGAYLLRVSLEGQQPEILRFVKL